MQKVDSAGTANSLCDGMTPASAVLKDGSAVYTPGLSEHRGTTSKFYHGDALGSTRGITNSSQTVTDTVLYDGFGMTVSRTGTTPTPFGFVGKGQYQTDNDSGLMLLGHRYYDASVGRFISSDPAKAGDNWYAYCDNNPLQKVDALGLDGWAIGGGALAGIVAGVATGNPFIGVAVGIAVGTAISRAQGNDWGTATGEGAAAGLWVAELYPVAAAASAVAIEGGMSGGGSSSGGSGGPRIEMPPNDGFNENPPPTITLPTGPYWRYGGDGGTYITTPGTPPQDVSLPPFNSGWINGPTPIEVTQPIPGVRAGTAAPWEWPGKPGYMQGTGGGPQFELPDPIEKYRGTHIKE
jgi:RHS repeat-associated protein